MRERTPLGSTIVPTTLLKVAPTITRPSANPAHLKTPAMTPPVTLPLPCHNGAVPSATTGLQPSALGQGAGVDRGEADLVDQLDDRPLGIRVVAGDRDRQAIGGRRLRVAVIQQAPEEDRVEGLHHDGA